MSTPEFRTTDGHRVKLHDVPASEHRPRRVQFQVFNEQGRYLPSQSVAFPATTFLELLAAGTELFASDVAGAVGITTECPCGQGCDYNVAEDCCSTECRCADQETWFLAARERDRKRFANDPDRCQDCGWIESCRCGGRWPTLALPADEPAQDVEEAAVLPLRPSRRLGLRRPS